MTETLYSQLQKRLAQLENRAFMIPRYIEHDDSWLGKNPYKMEMIDEIKKQIEETKAAMLGIEAWRKSKTIFML